MRWGVLCLLVLCYQIAASTQLRCSLFTPSVLHMDNEETLLVTVHNYPSNILNFHATITVRDFPRKKYILDEKNISIKKENGFLGTAKITIPSTVLETSPSKKQFVSVIVNFDSCYLEKVVLLSCRTGYIFVQTDKPIYTPGSQVLYRIFTTSLSLDPVSKPVAIEFKTPDNVVVQQERLHNKSSIVSKSFTITDPASLGVWTISAKYKDSPVQDYKTHFEVKEYVLPSFAIKIIPNKKYFLSCDEEFKVQILANYVYGKPVIGKAIVLFGAKKGSPDTSLTISSERIQINNGEGVAILKRQTIENKLPSNSRMLEWKLYVSVTVITDSGSDLLEAQLNDIHIVESPYKIVFIKTSKYFIPGMPYYFTVFVTYPDESPAGGVNVVAQPGQKKGITMEDGTIRLSVNTKTEDTSLKVTVLTNDGNLADNRQASAIMEASAYRSPDKNYLYLSIPTRQVKLQENIHIEFTVKNRKELLNNNVFYLILNKGRIIQAGRLIRQSHTVMTETFPITKDLLPSFRIVAYYVVDGSQEVVADSVWVDVEDTCAGTLQLKPFKDSDKREQQPGKKMNLKLIADHQASVGLVAVDKAVYALNNKLKFSQSKVWKWIEKHDIGCTAGSGADAFGVFYDAGLTLQTNFGSTTAQRIDPFCQGNRKVNRRRRETEELIQRKNLKALEYAGLQNSCCIDGMRENPMGYSCEHRSHLIQDGKNCIDAFLDCCKHIENIDGPDASILYFSIYQSSISRILQVREEAMIIPPLAVPDEESIEDPDEEFMKDSYIAIRTAFPESWLWETQLMNENPDENGISTKKLNIYLQHSITTWEVLAVSLSKGNGICVSDPYNIVARMDFFIDLKLPYSIVRNEQVEIHAILYNYGNADIRVRVQWTYNEKFCSPSSSKKSYSRIVIVKADSSMVIPYVVVPLEVGFHDIEVKAVGQFVSDAVKKKLKVVPEGNLIVRTLKSVVLNPEVMARAGGVQEERIPAVDLKNVVPFTEVKTLVTIQGLPISEMVQQSIDGINLNHLINLPSGCGEQNMMMLTSTVIATHFLDTTGQWERVGVDRRMQAIQYINAGISKQLAYRKKEEAAYSGFQRTLASTWLTAYVVRIFSLASSLTNVDKGGLCESVKWLIVNKQDYEGAFREDAPIYDTTIMGGLEKSSAENKSALTAFVLIAILDSASICTEHVDNLQMSIDKASSYISQQYLSLEIPYSIAIASYALAKAEKLYDINKLMLASTDSNHWNEEGYSEITIESTSYALLTLLKMREHKKASPLAQWLAEKRLFGRFYGSTQATIMMFQALAQYYIDMPKHEDVNMDITYKLPGKLHSITQKIDVNNLLVARTDQVSTSGEFMVTAKGKGQGTFTVNAVYYAKPEEDQNKCNNFELDVKIKNEAPAEDQEAKSTVSMEICTRFLESTDAAMSVMEISMMTGFVPDINKLNSDKTFSKYEINKNAVDKEMLILYFDKIAHEKDLCLKLQLHQYFEIGYIQPASVTVYEYYAKENRCTQYYHVDEDSKLLKRICVGNVCRCTEENCFVQQQTPVSSSMRSVKASDSAVNYVYKTTLSHIKEEVNYVIYVMTIKLVLKEGIDQVTVDEERHFISHKKCLNALNLEIGQDYLVWGIAKDSWLLASKYSYMITKDTWIEKWPKSEECQNPQYQQLCSDLSSFSLQLSQS